MRDMVPIMGSMVFCLRSEKTGATESKAQLWCPSFGFQRQSYLREGFSICLCWCCLRYVWNETTNHSERSNSHPACKEEQPWLVASVVWREGECLTSLPSVLFQYPYSVEMNFKRMVWDPKRGFVIPSHAFVYSGVLTCTATVNGSVFTSYYLAQRLGEWQPHAKEPPQGFCFIAKPLGIISWLASILFDIIGMDL